VVVLVTARHPLVSTLHVASVELLVHSSPAVVQGADGLQVHDAAPPLPVVQL
jgi:hypothetical protein